MPMNPDGWKDEEGDVDEDRERLQREFDNRIPFFVDYPLIKVSDTSARPCGCDIGANWVCARHQFTRKDVK